MNIDVPARAAADATPADRCLAEVIAAANAHGVAADSGTVIALYREWIAAHEDCDPDLAPQLAIAWFNLGFEASRSGDDVAAATAYRTALAWNPVFHPAALNLGLLLERHGNAEQALDSWTGALQTVDARTALLNQRARLLERLGRFGEAEDALCASLGTDAAQPDAVHHWIHLRQRMCRWPILPENAFGAGPGELLADCGPLAALSLTDRVAGQTAITARWIARRTVATPCRLSPASGYRHDRLRIGYLSSDFGRHAMSYLIAELFERHDRTRFSVHGYCLSGGDGSDIRNRIVGSFDTFTMLRDMSDEQAARRIAFDEIDVLIDLNGLTLGSRPQILRWKPAPVQATYLGFVGPLPLPELDYILCDDFVVPPHSAALYRPTPLYIGAIYQANDTKREIGPPVSRAENGLPLDAFVFCCFSNHYKVTPDMFGAWMTILAKVPNSVLWLSSDNVWSRESMLKQATFYGVAPSRLVFAERVAPAAYIRRLAIADLFLDTFPYNAGTVASDALRMGLPLLTLMGESFASRMAGRLLRAMGADAGIAETLAGYVETAVMFATRPDLYARYRGHFSEANWRHTIGDMAAFTQQLESALLRVASRVA